ncbi:hypothetical protein PENTCL1PPCAC_24870, partial [Pristionchus entomophagus]
IVKSRLGYDKEDITVDDAMLRMYAVDDPRNENAWRPISSGHTNDLLPTIQHDLCRRKDLVEYLRQKTGWTMTVGDLADLADNIEQMETFHEKLPMWLERPSLIGYDKSRILQEISSFSEHSQISCSLYGPCRDLMSEKWLEHIAKRIELARQEHHAGSRKTSVALFSTHTEVILSTLRKMGVAADRMPTSGGFVTEVTYPRPE